MKKVAFFLSLAILHTALAAQTKLYLDSALTYSFDQNGDSTLIVSQAYEYDFMGTLQKEIRIESAYSSVLYPSLFPAEYHYFYDKDKRVTDCFTFMMTQEDTNNKKIFIYWNDGMLYSQLLPTSYYDEEDEEMKTVFQEVINGTFYGLRAYNYDPLLNRALQASTLENMIFYNSDSIIIIQDMYSSGFWQPFKSIYFSYDNNDRLSSAHLQATYGDFDFELSYNLDNECSQVEVYRWSGGMRIKTDEFIRIYDEAGKPAKDYLLYTRAGESHRIDYHYDNNGHILSEMAYSIADTFDLGEVVEKKYYYYSIGNNVKERSIHSVLVYPNPTTGQLTISLPNSSHEVGNIEIYNVVGQKLQSTIVNLQSEIVLDVSSLAKGMYFLKAGNKMVKFVKE